MKLAMDNGIRSIAFPSISTGVYSFPVELAAKIAVHTVNRFLQDNPDCFDLVEWVLFDTIYHFTAISCTDIFYISSYGKKI
ncbi:macro domain-containing protein [Clostridium sp. OM05-9]|uniref:macro domain-containing protein n=1 Tax=Clostridium sp. OM05-9 TaxID=2293045 RepID=UPI00325C1B42